MARDLAKKLAEVAIRRQSRRQGLLIGTINEESARDHFLGRFLEDAGFVNTVLGFQMCRVVPIMTSQESGGEVAEENDQDIQEST